MVERAVEKNVQKNIESDSLFSTALCYAPRRSFGIVNLFVPLARHKVQINTSGRTLKQMDKGGTQTGAQILAFAERLRKFDII